MFCINCDKEDSNLSLQSPVCKTCRFDNSYVLRLLVEEGDDEDYENIGDDFRTSEACAQRCVILYGVMTAGYGKDRNEIVGWLKGEGLWEFVSRQELDFLESKNPSDQQFLNARWRGSALYLLLWALKKLPSALDFSGTGDSEEIHTACHFYLNSTREFIKSCDLRDENEIIECNDIIHRAHWRIRDAQLNGTRMPKQLDIGVVQEMHHAINWLMDYEGQEWDEVSTDT